MTHPSSIGVIGAGIGGLAAALRLAAAGCAVTLFERHGAPGGKMRTLPSAAGPVDAGPTVLTMKDVFEDLFAAAGTRLSDHVTLHPLPILARHHWRDGTRFDLHADREATAAEIRGTFGAGSEADYRAFTADAARLFDAFEDPMMRTARPSLARLTARVARDPGLLRAMAPHLSLAARLARRFREPKLAQLFGRYATYVGGCPAQVPAILSLVSEAEARGVWHVDGGMHRLATALATLIEAKGGRIHYGTHIDRIDTANGTATGLTVNGTHHAFDAVLFNGDPRALRTGALGPDATEAVPETATEPRSLSADVLAFAATLAPGTPDLAHHTVFFGDDPATEFAPLMQGARPLDPTVYICAQDRGAAARPPGPERFEIIVNAPPGATDDKEGRCPTPILTQLARFGLRFDPPPGPETLTTPQGFDTLFPASLGSLYGRSPSGMMAPFQLPTAQTRITKLYLAGGGAHPGAGVPMAALSGRHAAETILKARTSTSTSRRRDTPGGMSTGSATIASVPSRSSAS
ncbi:1-hydroxycarotenoid 3,4-desaturase CrtD [Aestuariibius sp. 2305UL40-4]|uniref:1-hydroxycarotenoid 3,4-desaturase CrtD n=1 Tax=Aestuariibius violaceus TaxID=3234132 RepID=UPI00345F15B9